MRSSRFGALAWIVLVLGFITAYTVTSFGSVLAELLEDGNLPLLSNWHEGSPIPAVGAWFTHDFLHEDEQVLINESISCLYMADNRFDAINKAIREGCDIAILDDGFQDYSIKKDLNILCFNSNQLIGNGMTIPSGPLRESLNSIKKAQIIVINGEQNDIFEKKLLSIYKNIKIFYTSYKPLNIDRFANKQLFAFAGIGNPNNFFNLLKKNGLNIKKNISFPDHYEFTKFELQNLVDESLKKNLELITTEKDYCRIKKFGFNEINYLQNELHIPKKSDLMNQILKIYD